MTTLVATIRQMAEAAMTARQKKAIADIEKNKKLSSQEKFKEIEKVMGEEKEVCPECKGDGCDHCDDKGYHMNEEQMYVVRYHGPDKNSDSSPMSKAAAAARAKRGNSIDKVGGKYTVVPVNKKGHDMKEEIVDEIDPIIAEGTWALPRSDKQKAELKQLMSKPIKLGKEGDEAADKMYGLIGDDELFDDLYVAGKKNPNGDARPVIKKHMKRLGVKEEVEIQEHAAVDTQMSHHMDLLATVNSILMGEKKELDPVNKKALKKDFDDREDQDIDNDGDKDDSDEYLHKKRQAISKSMKDEKKDKKSKGNSEPIDINPSLDEMSDSEMKKREEIVMKLKKKEGDFKKRYGDRWKDVMYATANKLAMKK